MTARSNDDLARNGFRGRKRKYLRVNAVKVALDRRRNRIGRRAHRLVSDFAVPRRDPAHRMTNEPRDDVVPESELVTRNCGEAVP